MKKSEYELRLDDMRGLFGEKEFCSFKFDDYSSDYAFFSVEYEKPADKEECRNAIISMLDSEGMYPVDRYDIKTMVEDCSEGFYYSWLVSDDDYPTRDSIKQKLKKHPKMKSMFVMTEGDVTLIDVNNFFDIVEEAADDVFPADSIDYIIQGKYRPKKRNKKRCSIFCFCDSKAVCDKGRVYDKYELEVTCYKKILEIQDEEPQIHSDLNKNLEIQIYNQLQYLTHVELHNFLIFQCKEHIHILLFRLTNLNFGIYMWFLYLFGLL